MNRWLCETSRFFALCEHGVGSDSVFAEGTARYDGSDREERRKLEAVMREHSARPAKDICKALLGYAVKKDEYLREIGEQDRIDDKTVFIIKRN